MHRTHIHTHGGDARDVTVNSIPPRHPSRRSGSARRSTRHRQAASRQCVLKMADGLCTEDIVSNVIEKNKVKDFDGAIACENSDRVNDVACDNVNTFYGTSDSDKLFDKLCAVKGSSSEVVKHEEGFLDMEMPCTLADEDCRKKRCVDRYDSSESSDSGVAVLSCTDCSGSSTASSDITDPGSPFSIASSHSEDSGSQPAKMPPTQSAHHPPWSWTEDSLPLKRPIQEKTAFTKRLKSEEDSKQSPTCLNNNLNAKQVANLTVLTKTINAQVLPKESGTPAEPSLNLISKKLKTNKPPRKPEVSIAPKMQQGKITEYFKSQMKSNGIKKELSNIAIKTNSLKKIASILDGVPQKTTNIRKIAMRKVATSPMSNRKLSSPRKILPAPSKLTEKVTVNNLNNLNGNFHPVTLTAVTFPTNLTYLPAKTPKPPDNITFIPQFTTISSDKLNAMPIVNRTSCLNVMQPIQKITTINNFNNCVKLNATVVPIVKLNTLPSRINGSNYNVALSVETGTPTVLSAKPLSVTNLAPKQQNITSINTNTSTSSDTIHSICHNEEPSTPDSDSGISSKDNLEISIGQSVTVEPQKSPILSQPKTIRFPAKQENSEPKEKRSHSSDSAACQWAECHTQFDTNGALLEHLQVKHVISQATQEQYVCLWLGCKVHGRKSCSRSWLERHVLAHAGTKPFRCIVDGCGMRFNSQLALERHVNNHFNSDNPQNGSSKKSMENGSAKLFKRNGKKIRFRRQPWSARMFDFIDSSIMEGLQYRLLTMTEKRTIGQFESVAGDAISLQSQVLARRIEPDGKTKLLLRWHPQDVIPDEWVPENEYKATKNVPIPNLQAASKNELKPLLFPHEENGSTRKKHRRKPIKLTT